MVSPPMRPISALLAAAASLAAAGCMQSGPPRDGGWSDAPPARVTGPPVNCLRTTSFNATHVRDNRTIDFMRSSTQGWRTTLPYSCPGLAVNDAFTYETRTGELCSIDVIYPLETAGGLRRGAACGLGEFVPIELERR